MANEHMRTAAANLERALSDLQLYKNELRTNLENMRTATNDRIKQIDAEIQATRYDMMNTDSQLRNNNDSNHIRKIEGEKDQLIQQLAEEQRKVDEQVRIADQNATEISGFSKRLQMMA